LQASESQRLASGPATAAALCAAVTFGVSVAVDEATMA